MFSTNAFRLLAFVCVVAGCGNGAPYGDGGLTGGGGSGGGGVCSGAPQGSCREQTGLFCAEYVGVPAATLTTLMQQCTADPDAPGIWSSSGCTHSGAVGGCGLMEAGVCGAVWLYIGTVADVMAACAEQGGTWINP